MVDTTPTAEDLEREWRAYVEDLLRKRTVSDEEIRRNGIAAVRDRMEYGPARVRGADGEWYVVMSEARFREIMAEIDDGAAARARESDRDIAAGRVYAVTSGAEFFALLDALPDEDVPVEPSP